MPETVRIVVVEPDRDNLLEMVRELFTEYHAWLGDIVCSSRLTEEIASLPGPYSPPQGRLMLAMAEDVAVGCIGVRPHEGLSCEMKRLYVRPHARGRGIAPSLVEAAIAAARELGYREVLLSTVPGSMDAARSIYERMGFEVTAPFRDLSQVADQTDLICMRLELY